jgi:hypothetical protein
MAEDRRIQRTLAEHLERTVARALVIAGTSFWVIVMAVPLVGGNAAVAADAARTGAGPLLAALVILAVGWRHERLAAVLLAGSSTGVLVWGAIYGWEVGYWLIMVPALIAPMAVAAILFVLAARTEEKRATASEEQPPVE